MKHFQMWNLNDICWENAFLHCEENLLAVKLSEHFFLCQITEDSFGQTKCTFYSLKKWKCAHTHKSLQIIFTHIVISLIGMTWHFWFFFIIEVMKFFQFCIFPVVKIPMSTTTKILIQFQICVSHCFYISGTFPSAKVYWDVYSFYLNWTYFSQIQSIIKNIFHLFKKAFFFHI